MGNKSSSQHKKVIKKDKKCKQIVRILNLGISGSGKTTFAKQMKIIASGGFTGEEKDIQKLIIFQNIKLGLQELIKFAEKHDDNLEPSNLKHSRFMIKLDTLEWTDKISEKAKLLWTDPAIQRTWKTYARYQMQIYHLDYYMENIDRITSPSYIPTNEDMLRNRQRTTGENITTFVNDKIKWELFDAGGQKPERTKWESIINTKESISAIIYFVSLDEYNVVSPEDLSKTKLQISLEAWQEVVKSEYIKQKHITLILFLNKLDIFSLKLTIPEDKEEFVELFPEYIGDRIDSATDLIKKKFVDLAPTSQEITSHCLCALDTSLIEILFKAVKNTIFDARVLSSMIKL